MEEMNQLGEHIPALDIAAKSMGITSKEFFKLVESGKLLAGDFLPRFTNQMRQQIRDNGSLQAGMKKLVSQQARFTNSFKFMIDKIFQSKAAEVLGNMFKGMGDGIEAATPWLVDMGQVLFETIDVIVSLTSALLGLGTALSGTKSEGSLLVSAWNGVKAFFHGLAGSVWGVIAGIEYLKELFNDVNSQDISDYMPGSEWSKKYGGHVVPSAEASIKANSTSGGTTNIFDNVTVQANNPEEFWNEMTERFAM